MSTYLPFFNITVEHEFFSGVCSCLDFVATERTCRLIKNAGLLLRKTNAGIHVAYDESRLEALQQYALDPDDALCFEFKVYSSSAEFKSFSEPFSGSNGEIAYLTNENASQGDAGKLVLHAQKNISKIDLLPPDAVQLKDMLSQKDRLIPPVFVVKICANDKQNGLFGEQLRPTFRNYQLRFKARETVWKYFLLGDMAMQSSYIVDAENKIEFESAGTSVLADQRIAMTFRSKQSIPLHEKYDFNFQLKQKVSGGDKIVIKRLPVARINQTGSEVVAEQGMVVSEIYINS